MPGRVTVSWPLVSGELSAAPLAEAAEVAAQAEATFVQPEDSGERCTLIIELLDGVLAEVLHGAATACMRHHACNCPDTSRHFRRHSCNGNSADVQVSEVCILSSARICEVSVCQPGGPASYVGSVRGSPVAGNDPTMHLLAVSAPPGGERVLQLKMLSLAERTQWRVAGLGFRRGAALPRQVFAGPEDFGRQSATTPSACKMPSCVHLV